MIVKEYKQQIELLMMMVGVREEVRITIERFHSSLNYEIRSRVELLPYNDRNEFVQLCMTRYKKQKRKLLFSCLLAW